MRKRSIRSSRPTTRTPSPPRPSPPARPRSSSSACTAWAKRSTRKCPLPARLRHPCRIYAPVGEHEDLLSYLVRRLLENGANTSFVNRLADEEAPIANIIRDPVETAERERERARRGETAAPAARHLLAGAEELRRHRAHRPRPSPGPAGRHGGGPRPSLRRWPRCGRHRVRRRPASCAADLPA